MNVGELIITDEFTLMNQKEACRNACQRAALLCGLSLQKETVSESAGLIEVIYCSKISFVDTPTVKMEF